MQPIPCYCDASFDPQIRVAIIGWRINDGPIYTQTIKNTNNTRAEIFGLITLINHLDPVKKYIVYTDCESIIRRIATKQKLIDSQFKNNKGELLHNHDLYQALFHLLNENIIVTHIKGHMPAGQMDDTNVNFSQLDKYVRKKLRNKV